MAEKNQFIPIDEGTIKDNSISALATKPNQPSTYGKGGLSADDLKKRFDALVLEVIGRYNELANIFNGKDGVDAASYIALSTREGGSLRGLLSKIVNADGALILDNKTISEIITDIQTSIGNVETDIGVVDEGTNLASLISDLQTTIGQIAAGNTVAELIGALQTVIQAFYVESTGEANFGTVNVDGTVTANMLSAYDRVSASTVQATDGEFTNLTVKGTTVTNHQESLVVNDNIIITTSSGDSFSPSGIVMRTGVDSTEAYAILLVVEGNDKVVKIGKGTISETTDSENLDKKTYEFDFTPDQALPLAARDGFDNKGGYLPMWDADLNAFVPSDKTAESVATRTYVETYVAEYVANNGGGDTAAIAEFLHKINTGGLA